MTVAAVVALGGCSSNEDSVESGIEDTIDTINRFNETGDETLYCSATVVVDGPDDEGRLAKLSATEIGELVSSSDSTCEESFEGGNGGGDSSLSVSDVKAVDDNIVRATVNSPAGDPASDGSSVELFLRDPDGNWRLVTGRQ